MGISLKGQVANESGHGLPNILVSNGETVVETDIRGHYEIEAEHGIHSFLFITTPAGYVARGEFFKPIPEKSTSLDFTFNQPLKQCRKKFTLAHISDTHLGVELERVPTQSLLSTDLKEIEDKGRPDLIVCTGDLTELGTLQELNLLKKTISETRIPFIPVWGGHDSADENSKIVGNQTVTKNFEKVFGPVYFSFDWGGRHFIVYATEDEYFSDEDIQRKDRWLISDLSKKSKTQETVLLIHAPPSVKLLDLLAKFDVSLVLHGHTHINNIFTYKGITVSSVTPTCFGGIDTNPRGYSEVRFSERNFKLKFRSLGFNKKSVKPLWGSHRGASNRSLDLQWDHELPGHLHRANPVVRDGDLFLSLSNDQNRGHAGVYCLSSKSGEPKWVFNTDASIRNSVAISEDGVLVALSTTGEIHALEVFSGKPIWKTELPGYPDIRSASAPVVTDSMIYAGAPLGYGAFKLEFGEQTWHTQFEESVNRPAYITPIVSEGLLILLLPGIGIVALDKHTGTYSWKIDLQTQFQYPSPVMNDNGLLAAGDPGKIVFIDQEFGKVLWQRNAMEYSWNPGTSKYLENQLESGYPYPTAMVSNANKLYFATSSGEIIAWDLNTGERLWVSGSGKDMLDMTPHRRSLKSILAQPVVAGKNIVVCGVDGVLRILDGDTGELKQDIQLPAPITAAPVFTDSSLIVGTWNGHIYCFTGW